MFPPIPHNRVDLAYVNQTFLMEDDVTVSLCSYRYKILCHLTCYRVVTYSGPVRAAGAAAHGQLQPIRALYP